MYHERFKITRHDEFVSRGHRNFIPEGPELVFGLAATALGLSSFAFGFAVKASLKNGSEKIDTANGSSKIKKG